MGRIQVDEETITVEKHGGVLVGPKLSRQVFNAPEAELRPAEESDTALSYPTDSKQLRKELSGLRWPFFA